MMLTNRMKDTPATLAELMEEGIERVLDVTTLPVSYEIPEDKPAKKNSKKPAKKPAAKKAPAKKSKK